MPPNTPGIDHIPAELILTVFHQCIRGWRQQPHSEAGNIASIEQEAIQPFLLSQVCSRWRKLAVDDPSLWTTIHISRWSDPHFLYLTRSSPLPIDLYISTPGPTSSDQTFMMDTILEWILAVSLRDDALPIPHRIRSLHLIASDDANSIESFLKVNTFPRLVSFTARPHGTERANMIAYPNFKPPLPPSLTFLALYQFSRALKIHTLRKIFTSCPLLETLVLGTLNLECKCDPNAMTDPRSEVPAPSLRKLALASPIFDRWRTSHNKTCGATCTCVFRHLVAPQLEYLEVAGSIGDTLHHLIPLITRRTSAQGSTAPVPMTAAPLNVMLNAGTCAFGNPSTVLGSLPTDIHLHIIADRFKSADCLLPDASEHISRMLSTTFYHRSGENSSEIIPVAQPMAEATIEPGPFHDSRTLDLTKKNLERRRQSTSAIDEPY